MTTRLTLFTATLVQDSALSLSGLDRVGPADRMFTIVGGKPVMVGRGIKGAAVAMARRFFDPLPRVVSDDVKHGTLRRSAWEFQDAAIVELAGTPELRAGVGIRQKTGSRARGVLFDREVIPAATKWLLSVRVDWSQAESRTEAEAAEGILGYVLAKHWGEGRCWLGGDVARGLGWCHLENLRAYRFDTNAYEAWVNAGRPVAPDKGIARYLADDNIPLASPTRGWSFRTLDASLEFGEYVPDNANEAWGLDMLAVGTHGSSRTLQARGEGTWAFPDWSSADDTPNDFPTDRAILMEGVQPLLSGSSIRGPLRHAFSRACRIGGNEVSDPHVAAGDVGEEDPAGALFGTTRSSSRILIRDAIADGDWYAAKMHMHAEDEFSASTYESSKRDAVRLLKATFPVRILVEGPTSQDVGRITDEIDNLVALGRLGHLGIGGHKARGAGWGRWRAGAWIGLEVEPVASVPETTLVAASEGASRVLGIEGSKGRSPDARPFREPPASQEVRITQAMGVLEPGPLSLGEAASLARKALDNRSLVAWWCEPAIDFNVTEPPATFGRSWPDDSGTTVDEVAFFTPDASWRAARDTSGPEGQGGWRWALMREVAKDEVDSKQALAVHVVARLHAMQRFQAADTGRGDIVLRQWRVDSEGVAGFTICGVSE